MEFYISVRLISSYEFVIDAESEKQAIDEVMDIVDNGDKDEHFSDSETEIECFKHKEIGAI